MPSVQIPGHSQLSAVGWMAILVQFITFLDIKCSFYSVPYLGNKHFQNIIGKMEGQGEPMEDETTDLEHYGF